jgi:hypothetical protein
MLTLSMSAIGGKADILLMTHSYLCGSRDPPLLMARLRGHGAGRSTRKRD